MKRTESLYRTAALLLMLAAACTRDDAFDNPADPAAALTITIRNGAYASETSAAHPVPEGSSGWFFPGWFELATMAFGVPTNYTQPDSPYHYYKLTMLKLINPQLKKAGGNELGGEYWTNNNSLDKAWWIDLDKPMYNGMPKSKSYKVRTVLAF